MKYVLAMSFSYNCPCCLCNEFEGRLFLFDDATQIKKHILENWGTKFYVIYSTITGKIVGDVEWQLSKHSVNSYRLTLEDDIYTTKDRGDGVKIWEKERSKCSDGN